MRGLGRLRREDCRAAFRQRGGRKRDSNPTPALRRERIANLKLAREIGGELQYAGVVGTGFSMETMRRLLKRLNPLVVKRSPVADLAVKGAVWTRPALRAEVHYRGLTATGELRHASFKGLREDL
jgi:bifunctional non-homologous end joining protein LigD